MVLPADSEIEESSDHRIDDSPDQAVSVGAASAFPRALAVLPRAAEPNVVVTHDGFFLSSETNKSQ